MSESKDTRELCKEIEQHGGMVFACVGSRMQPSAWPDRQITHRLWSGWIEFKNAKRKVDLKQTIIMERLNKAKPCAAYVVRHPNKIMTPRDEFICEFDGTGIGLLRTLNSLLTG
jgi:hypothetical protein